MSLINVMNLTFAYEGSYDTIFEDVSFQMDTDWKLGFVGRNGRGKTTFLKLLLGEYAYKGTISASVDFEYFPYEVEDKTQTTLDVAEQLVPLLEQWRLVRELKLLHVDDGVLWRPFDTLSHGEQIKVLLAVLFLKEGRFLLIDEPTNHLDHEARDAVAQYLNKKRGFILVSHDRSFLDRCVDHILSINKMDISIQKGNFSSWYVNKQAQDQLEKEENDRLQDEIKRLNQSMYRTAGWSSKLEKTKKGTKNSGLKPDRGYIGHQAAKMMKRSKSIEKRKQSAVDEKSALLKNIERMDSLKLSPMQYWSNRLISLEQVSVFYGEKEACLDISFEICRGDRIALRGRNGSGKSSILRLICGEKLSYKGTLYRAENLKISIVSQSTSYLNGSLKAFARQEGIDESLFRAILNKLDFDTVMYDKDMSDFSSGQKKKVLLAKSLCEQAHLYIWDEPLNFIDIFSRFQVEALLKSYPPTMIFVEHDRTFTEQIATKIVEL